MVEEFQEKSNNKICQKFEAYDKNRQTQLKNMMKRLEEHVSDPSVTFVHTVPVTNRGLPW